MPLKFILGQDWEEERPSDAKVPDVEWDMDDEDHQAGTLRHLFEQHDPTHQNIGERESKEEETKMAQKSKVTQADRNALKTAFAAGLQAEDVKHGVFIQNGRNGKKEVVSEADVRKHEQARWDDLVSRVHGWPLTDPRFHGWDLKQIKARLKEIWIQAGRESGEPEQVLKIVDEIATVSIEATRWMYLSFARNGWLGGVFVQGATLREALIRSKVLGINPGGEVLSQTYESDEKLPAAEFRERLLNKAELEEAIGHPAKPATIPKGMICSCCDLPMDECSGNWTK